ncbi:MAG: hypothetical protein M9895_18960 [Aquamicrobium sp.]|uniref:hypothetical protein n=1 Tax=Aquamicrobium sp. TaxID=1872579 RepID=UPI00349EEBA1|nr:hypothetical protein [Aquamicrobium sp.]
MTMRCVALLFGLFLAGCATATIEDAVPSGALAGTNDAATPASAREPAPAADPYHNLNEPRAAAAPQITPDEKASETADLRAKREALARQTRGAGTGNGSAELRRIAATHGEETLKEIGGE